MRTYILQILGEKSIIEKEAVIEAFKTVLPKDKNFTLSITELQRMDVDGDKITAVRVSQ